MPSAERLRCVVIVSFLDEEAYLPTFLASLGAQRRFPDRVVLVDDGSTDRSLAICREFAASEPRGCVLQRPPREPGKDRLVGAPELAAFLWARQQIDDDADVVVKMDADLQLAPEHVETVLAQFEADPRLGMAGAYLHARRPDGTVVREGHPPEHVRGPTRFYRTRCLEEILPLPLILGWDGADEVRARDRGWRTRSVSVPGEPSLHLRPTGAHDGRLRAHARWGLCAYAVGAHPLAVLGGAALRVGWRPRVLGSLACLYGFAAAAIRRAPRAPADIRSAKRREHALAMRSGLRSQLRRLTAAPAP